MRARTNKSKLTARSSASSPAEELARASSALKARDPARALAAVLAAWRSCRHDRLVAVIEELSSRVSIDEACFVEHARLRPILRAFAGQLEEIYVNSFEPEDWIRAIGELDVATTAVAHKHWFPWRLWFQGEQVRAELVWPRVPGDAAGSLAEWLAWVPAPGRRRVVIESALEIDAGLARMRRRFASLDLAN